MSKSSANSNLEIVGKHTHVRFRLRGGKEVDIRKELSDRDQLALATQMPSLFKYTGELKSPSKKAATLGANTGAKSDKK